MRGVRLTASRGCALLKIDGNLQARYRLHALFGELFRKFQGPKKIVRIADGKRWHRVGTCKLGKLADRYRSLAQRVGAMHVQMDKFGCGCDAPQLASAFAFPP